MKKLQIPLFSLIVSIFLLSSCKTKFNKSCEALNNPDCVCLQIYDPVCGCNEVTYPNSCYAECASITNYSKGECK